MEDAEKGRRIVVALSGGVDSAAVAGLLVERGAQVVGVTMRLYDARGSAAAVGGRCCGPRDLEDARRVAAHLGIPFYVADYESEFRAQVVDDFVAEYAAGRTPNPCVRCNQHIKFTPLIRMARALGASALATGHYARIERGPEGVRLLRARDQRKDQSYFLFNMPRSALDFVEFPLGELSKDEVRAHALRLGLPNADKPESQEICFVPDGDYASFVAARAPVEPGEVVNAAGQVLGTHAGIHRFTIGQRRGIGVSGEAPQYVVSVDALTRRVKIGPAEDLGCRQLDVGEVAWEGPPPSAPTRAEVQIRYRHTATPAWIRPRGVDQAEVVFDQAERAAAPGQAAVFYQGDRVIGGGFIA